MADDEQFSLCWNNFNSNLSAGFHESLCRGDLVDVTLAAEGQFVKAHRLVLSVCSPYFRKMFTQMPANQHAFVFLKDVSHSALKDLIQFMYCGEVNVKQDALPAFISTAEALQIKGLTDGEPAPSQSPAKPSTPAPQQTIPAPSMSATSPRVRTQRSSTTRTYKLESEDSGDDKQQIVLQTQNQQQQIVQQQKRPAQRSITPHSVPSIKRVKNNDPLEATDPTQITVQTVADNKSTSGGEAEFIDLPMDLPTKSEPDYAEDAGEVETAEQEATYVEDDSYGDMKYDESYFTENDETAAATTAPTTSASTAVKAQTGTFSESYVSDAGDQSATEAQEDLVTKDESVKMIVDDNENVDQKIVTKDVQDILTTIQQNHKSVLKVARTPLTTIHECPVIPLREDLENLKCIIQEEFANVNLKIDYIKGLLLQTEIKSNFKNAVKNAENAVKNAENAVKNFKNDVMNDARSDIRNNVEIDLKKDVNNEFKNDTKSDEKNGVKNDLKIDVNSEVKNDIMTDAKSDTKNDVKSDAKNEDNNAIKNDVKIDVKSEVVNEITDRSYTLPLKNHTELEQLERNLENQEFSNNFKENLKKLQPVDNGLNGLFKQLFTDDSLMFFKGCNGQKASEKTKLLSEILISLSGQTLDEFEAVVKQEVRRAYLRIAKKKYKGKGKPSE